MPGQASEQAFTTYPFVVGRSRVAIPLPADLPGDEANVAAYLAAVDLAALPDFGKLSPARQEEFRAGYEADRVVAASNIAMALVHHGAAVVAHANGVIPAHAVAHSFAIPAHPEPNSAEG